MHTMKSALAIGLAVIVLSTSLATGTTLPRTGPVTRPEHPAIDSSKPSPEFGDDGVVVKGPLTLDPYALKCFPSKDIDKFNGEHQIWIKNTGTETIPPTFYITITWPDGTKYVYTVDVPLKPGDALGADVPAAHFKEPFVCGAKLSFTKPQN